LRTATFFAATFRTAAFLTITFVPGARVRALALLIDKPEGMRRAPIKVAPNALLAHLELLRLELFMLLCSTSI
jgi:hypothetical protein